MLRRVLVAGADLPLADRRTALQGIAGAGRPYRTLAEEHLAYLLIEEGKTDEAITALTALMQDQEASGALRARVGQVVTALGGTLPETSAGETAMGASERSFQVAGMAKIRLMTGRGASGASGRLRPEGSDPAGRTLPDPRRS